MGTAAMQVSKCDSSVKLTLLTAASKHKEGLYVNVSTPVICVVARPPASLLPPSFCLSLISGPSLCVQNVIETIESFEKIIDDAKARLLIYDIGLERDQITMIQQAITNALENAQNQGQSSNGMRLHAFFWHKGVYV